MDLQMLDAVGSARRANKKLSATLVRPERWTLFGRAGPMRFTNQFDAGSDSTHFSLRGNSQGLKGKLYIGVHRSY